MNIYPLSFYSFSALFNGLTSAILVPILLFRRSKTSAHILFLLFLLIVIEWSVFYFLWLLTPDAITAEFLARICMIGVLLMPPIFLHFVISLTGRGRNTILLGINYLLSLAFIFTVNTPLYVEGMKSIIAIPLWPIPGKIFALAVIHFIAVYFYTHVLMWQTIKSGNGVIRNQMIYVFIGTLSGGLAGATNFLSWYTSIPPILNIFTSVYVIMVTYAIVKTRLMDISVVISRSTAWVLTVLFLGSIYASLAWLYRTYVTPRIDLIFFVWTVIYGIIVGETFHRIRLFIQTTSDKVFLRGKYDYYKELSDVTAQITKTLSMENILNTLHKAFYEIIEVSNPRIYLPEDYDKPEVKELLAVKEPAFLGEDLVVPCLLEDRPIALIVLGKKAFRGSVHRRGPETAEGARQPDGSGDRSYPNL